MKRLASNGWARVFHRDGVKHRINVVADLVHLDGNTSPHFSITGDIQNQAKNGRWVDDCGGAIHEDILKLFPKLAPLVLVHLGDDAGKPMHAYANAAYWAGTSKYQGLDIPALARHLRVSEIEAADLVAWVGDAYGSDFDAITPADEAWRVCCEENGLPERWAVQAAEALAMLNLTSPTWQN